MEKLMNEVQTRIDAEKLLFDSKDNYTEEQIMLMVGEYAKMCQKSDYYIDLTAAYFNKLLYLAKKLKTNEDFVNNKKLKDDIALINVAADKWYKKKDREMRLDYDFINFYLENKLGYDHYKMYSGFIKEDMMNIYVVREMLDKKEVPQNVAKFLLTNNFLLSQYPGFHSESDLEQLRILALDKNKKNFENQEEYFKFIKASISTISNIKRYEKILHKKEKEALKLLKSKKD